MKITIKLFAITILAILLTGCAVKKAAEQPGKRDMSVMEKGTTRALVIAEFGTPMHSEERNGRLVDIFQFVQGYSTATKTGRAMFHGVADVATLGLWEIIGTPTEAIFDGNEITVMVTYDEDETVSEANVVRKRSR